MTETLLPSYPEPPPMLTRAWYIAAESRELKWRPLARTVAGVPLVLFRDDQGRAAALFDRCPHRNVQLSRGKVRQGQLQCPYHGWQFNGQGQCVHIPALPPGQKPPAGACVQTLPLKEQQGYLWVWPDAAPPPPDIQPFYLPYFEARGWHWDRLQSRIGNAVSNVVENFIDNPHTGYVHGGLFRTPASHWVDNILETTADGVRIDIREESQAESLLARLLVRGEVSHQDRFIYPATVEVRYAFGPGREIIGYQLCTPVSAYETRIFVHVLWQMGWLSPLVRAGFPFVGRLILQQDVGILESQGQVLQRYGEHFHSIEADSANLWIQAARQRLQRGAQLKSRRRQVRFRI
ncbi:MAG: aromatic ring-hydroxylating dioxygenase subunit alpha [Candidatus Sericytochromatia bacterium]|nr:aromatic ring-hydroxylating dioxygenase subunit alpha [Candidatus Sericytochromatia bacterium]